MSRKLLTRKFLLVLILIGASVYSVTLIWLQTYRHHAKKTPVHPQSDALAVETSRVLLVIAIVTAPVRIERRTAVRETWMTKCVQDPRCIYKFITDGQNINGTQLNATQREGLEKENRDYGDLVFAQSPPGVNYARRYLWLIQWLKDRYNYQYLLRMDDDYFVCIEKLMLELTFHRPQKKLWWGYLHCYSGAVWIDQGFHLVSRDLTENVLARHKNGSLPCSALLDQAFATWMNDYPGLIMFGDNGRVLNNGLRKPGNEICHTLLGIHKSYPAQMRMYWSIFQKEANVSYNNTVPAMTYDCKQKRHFNYKSLGKTWYIEMKPCKDNPVWGKGEFFQGREKTDGTIQL